LPIWNGAFRRERLPPREEAEEELKEAVASYEATEAGLGVRLKAEARGVIQWIHQYPELPRVRPKGYDE